MANSLQAGRCAKCFLCICSASSQQPSRLIGSPSPSHRRSLPGQGLRNLTRLVNGALGLAHRMPDPKWAPVSLSAGEKELEPRCSLTPSSSGKM